MLLRIASRNWRGVDVNGPLQREPKFFSTKPNALGRLPGKVAVITGAASGIGKATAAEFIKNGAKVILADVQHSLLESTAAELGPDATPARCDVRYESQVAAAVDLAVSLHGRLDIVYNNAGLPDPSPPLSRISTSTTSTRRWRSISGRWSRGSSMRLA